MRNKVECEIEYIELESSNGNPVDSVRATCVECGHQTESFGDSDSSIKRCLALMNEECPEGQNNFYVEEGED
jgi:hypothetical protein